MCFSVQKEIQNKIEIQNPKLGSKDLIFKTLSINVAFNLLGHSITFLNYKTWLKDNLLMYPTQNTK